MQNIFTKTAVVGLQIVFFLGALATSRVAAQVNPTGQIVGTITDPNGALVASATVDVEDTATAAKWNTVSGSEGNFVIAGLQAGSYRVTAVGAGFKPMQYVVKVDAGRTTNLTVRLEIGGTAEVVQVEDAAVDALEVTSNTIQSTVRATSIARLPLIGRTILDFSLLTAGAQFGGESRQSTFLGLPKASLNITLDGINNNANRFKSGDAGFVAFAAPRLGAIEEVTTSTSGLEADAAGEGGAQIRFVTRRGTNNFHGSLFWLHRNDLFNANTWINNVLGVRKSKLRLNEFGGNLGGPIWRDKVFFFFNYEEQRNPSTVPRETPILTTEAQSGLFRYVGTDGVTRTANLLQIAGANGFPSAIDPTIGQMLQAINSSASKGAVSPLDRFRNLLRWEATQRPITRYPTVRVDYKISDNLLWHGVLNLTRNKVLPDVFQGTDPAYPGFTEAGSTQTTRYVATTALNWTITPRVYNEFAIGRQSNSESFFSEFGPDTFPGRRILFPLSLVSPHARTARPADPRPLPTLRNNPVWAAYDNVGVVRGKHIMKLGGTLTHVSMFETLSDATLGGGGIPVVNLGVVATDPVASVLAASNLPSINTADLGNARALYALLTGRISAVSGGRALDEDSKTYSFDPLTRRESEDTFGFYFQDTWRARPDLSLNFGFRWEFQKPNVNTNNIYTSPTYEDLWGISGVGNLFKPGVFDGTPNPQILQRSKAYNGDYVNPAPNVGIAWNPGFQKGLMKILFGDKKSVFRAHYSLTYFREGMTTVQLHAGSNPGLTQSQSLVPGTPGFPGFFAPGTLSLGSTLPPFREDPASFSPPFDVSPFTFRPGFSIASIDPKVQAPSVHAWGFGIQRQLMKDLVVEVRYLGNQSRHLWRSYNLNEINIFENGFLKEFENARLNLAANRAAGVNSFANQGLPGQVALPIFETAFGPRGSQPALSSAQGFANGSFITFLEQGQAGALADAMSSRNTSTYLCRMTGNTFAPCASLGFNAPGPYPANFFNVNPHIANAFLLTDDSSSNYNALQVEVRRSFARGLAITANYTLSKSLTNRFSDSFIVRRDYLTLRDKKLDRAPSPWDLRHVFIAYGSYDFPLGNGHKLQSRHALVNQIIGGWTISAVVRIQSGRVFQLTSGRRTVNNSDSGVILHGITQADLESMVTTRYATTNVQFFPSELIGPDGRSNRAFIDFPTTPGQFGSTVYLHGPWLVKPDLALNKVISLSEQMKLEFRAEAFNAFNHQTWLVGSPFWTGDPTSVSIDSTFFGRTTSSASGARQVQFRVGLSF